MVNFANLRAKIQANRAPAAPAAKPAARPAPAAAARPAPRPAGRPAPAPAARPATNARPVGRPAAKPAAPAGGARGPFNGGARPAARPVARGSIFAGVGQASLMVDANYTRAGRYVSRIDSVMLKSTRKHEPFVAIESTVLVVYDDANGAGHRAGETVTHYVAAYGKQGDYFLATMKGFISVALGCNVDEIDENDCETIVGEEQPLAGLVVEWHGRDITLNTVNAETGQPNTFTRISYKRRLGGSELAGLLDEQQVAAWFPNGLPADDGEGAAAEEQPAEEAPAEDAQEGPQLYEGGQGGYQLEDGTPCDEAGNPIE